MQSQCSKSVDLAIAADPYFLCLQTPQQENSRIRFQLEFQALNSKFKILYEFLFCMYYVLELRSTNLE